MYNLLKVKMPYRFNLILLVYKVSYLQNYMLRQVCLLITETIIVEEVCWRFFGRQHYTFQQNEISLHCVWHLCACIWV